MNERQTPSRPLRILHISDLHECVAYDGMPQSRQARVDWDAEERGYVLGPEFTVALRDMAKKGIDLLVLTGDVADWGHPAEYAAVTSRIDQILGTIGLPRSRFFAVPGNHDVRREINRQAWSGLRGWYDQTRDGRWLGRWLRDVGAPPPGVKASWRERVLDRTAAFWSWMRAFDRVDLCPVPPKRLGYRKSLQPGALDGIDLPIHIIGLDSAWLCGDELDQGHILVTEEQVQAHVRDGARPLDGIRIGLVHHPLDHLADHHDVRRLLADDGVDLLLHGHQHTPLVLASDGPSDRLRVLAAGSLMDGQLGKGWPNSFHLLEWNASASRVTVHFRKWSHDGRFWAVGSDIYRDARDGTLEIPPSEGPPIVLRVAQPGVDDRTVQLNQQTITIGRAPTNTLPLADRKVSRAHGEICLRGATYVYCHKSLTNRTVHQRHSGERTLLRPLTGTQAVAEVALENEDRLFVGGVTLFVELEDQCVSTDKEPDESEP